uniref:Alcohol dehydrogenase-like N-terminal domain-containing protein n=1 Tax=Hyaloperonospora arabidopsidis (strain Emoy2) TaxID=559515 RepID=M4B5V1_HYAAE
MACDIADGGEAKVRVLRAAASLFDAQTCRGTIEGRSGVLGRSFVGSVSELRPLASEETELTTVDPVKVLDRVVASPYLMRAPLTPDEQQDQSDCDDDALPQRSTCSSSCVVGISASSGTLAEYIVLPVSNLAVVPPSIPDDLALLAGDVSVVLSIASELQRRHVTNVAILSDGPATILSNLLTRLLHQDMQFPAQNLHVFSASATCSSTVWSWHASVTPLDTHEPADVDHLIARQTELALDAVVDLIGSKASAELAISLVQSMGCVVFVDRSRLELHPPSLVAMDMNAVVVRELELVSVHNCRGYLDNALQYLVTQSESQQSTRELRTCLLDDVVLSQALSQLQALPGQTLEGQCLQVRRC